MVHFLFAEPGVLFSGVLRRQVGADLICGIKDALDVKDVYPNPARAACRLTLTGHAALAVRQCQQIGSGGRQTGLRNLRWFAHGAEVSPVGGQ